MSRLTALLLVLLLPAAPVGARRIHFTIRCERSETGYAYLKMHPSNGYPKTYPACQGEPRLERASWVLPLDATSARLYRGSVRHPLPALPTSGPTGPVAGSGDWITVRPHHRSHVKLFGGLSATLRCRP